MNYYGAIEYLYYSVNRQYQKWGEKEFSSVYALCFVALVQTFNCLTIVIWLLLLNFFKTEKISGIYFFLLFFILLAIDYRILHERKTNIIHSKNITESKRQKGRTASVVYVVLSFIFFIGSLIYYLIE